MSLRAIWIESTTLCIVALSAAADAADRNHEAGGQVDQIYAIDVDGTRLVIDANHLPGATAEELAALQAVVDSITIGL